MTVKNFKVGQGIDLDGLVLTNGTGELLVNGNAIATEAYVSNAVSNVTVDLSQAAGQYLDWNILSEQIDVNVANVASAIAGPGLTTDINNKLIPAVSYAQGISINVIDNGLKVDLSPYGNLSINPADNGIEVNVSSLATTLVNSYNIAQSNALPTYTTANVLANYGLNIGYNDYYGVYGIDVDTSIIATRDHVANSISNLVDSAPETLNTLNELAAALQDNPNVIASLQSVASGKQNALIEGLGIDIVGNTISANMPDIANAIAGSYLDYNTVGQAIDVNVYGIANAIAGTGITFDAGTGKLTAAPGYISSVDSSFDVSESGQLSLSDTITIASVELTDTVANVTAASDVFGNADTSTYAMGSDQTVATLPTGTEVAEILITIKEAGINAPTRTSKLTVVNTGSDSPTWTEYGIINSGSFPATTVSFDSSRNLVVNVTGSSTYAVKGVFTTLK